MVYIILILRVVKIYLVALRRRDERRHAVSDWEFSYREQRRGGFAATTFGSDGRGEVLMERTGVSVFFEV